MELRGALALLLGVLPQVAAEERGRYALKIQGRDAGSEEFRIETLEGGKVVLFAKSRFEVPLSGGQKRSYATDTVLTLDAARSPHLYAGYRKAGREEEQVKIEWADGVATSGKKQVRTSALHLFDTTVTAHLLPLARRVEKGKRVRLKLFNPNALADVEGSVEDKGEALLRGKDAAVKVREVLVSVGYLAYTVHLDPAGRLLRVWCPGAGSLAELEGFEGWTPEPVAPEGVEETEVGVTSGTLTLKGTLTRPRGSARVPVALLLSATGPQDRNGNAAGVDEFARPGADVFLYREIARALAASGGAVLRLDDRPAGRIRLADLKADAEAALAFLKSRADLGPATLVGHDEGALIAMAIAARDDAAVAGLLLLAPPAEPFDRLLAARTERQLREQGVKDEALEDLGSALRKLFERIRTSTEEDLEIDERRTYVAWIRDRLAWNPAELSARVRVPIRIFRGSKDRESANLEAYPKAEVRTFEGLDHRFVGSDGRVSEDFLKALAGGR
jgi:pimeloyl-ACP methyl ester carboxylesterase